MDPKPKKGIEAHPPQNVNSPRRLLLLVGPVAVGPLHLIIVIVRHYSVKFTCEEKSTLQVLGYQICERLS
jgi:hypothetical protein